jgi:exopolysaccharide biosynthesis polyprenyl glycosylphosphotransferase
MGIKPVYWRLRPTERRLILIIGDLGASSVSLLVSLYFWAQKDAWLDFSFIFLTDRTPIWYYLLPVVWIILLVELYDTRRASRIRDTIMGIAVAALISFGLYLVVYFTAEPSSLPRRGVAFFIAFTSLLTFFWRMLYIKIFTAPEFMRRVLVVGAGRAGSSFAKIVHDFWPPPFFMVGFIDDSPEKIGEDIEDYPVLGGCHNMLDIVQQENVTDLVFAISGEMSSEMFQTLILAEEQGIEITTMPIMYEELLGRVPILLLRSDWILRSFVDQIHAGEFFEFAKRMIDIICGIIGATILVFLSPFIAIATFLDSGRPILYLQNRLGKNGRVYTIIKFRTMRQDAEKDGKARPAVENDERVTRVGRLLRKSHLDEFPQFINVIKGEMSMIGPRAERLELVKDLQAKVPFYRARLLVKPGLTGWAQINYGYASTADETAIKLEYDLYYIKHRNLMLDFRILFSTMGAVIGLRGQ